MFDPDGRKNEAWLSEAPLWLQEMWNATPDGTNSYWFNNGSGFTSYQGGSSGAGGSGLAYNSTVSYGGTFTMGDWTYAMPPIVLTGNKSGWAAQFRNHMEKYGNTSMVGNMMKFENTALSDSYFDGFVGGAQSSWNYIKGQFFGESYWNGLANTFTLGAYGTVKTINSLIDATRNVPNYTANDYSYGAGYLTEKVAEAIILKEVSQINPFGIRGGYGFKIGKVEFLYSNPSVGGGTIFSYVSATNNKFRLDYHGLPSLNRGRTLHFHTNYWGYTNSPHRSLNPFRWGQPIK